MCGSREYIRGHVYKSTTVDFDKYRLEGVRGQLGFEVGLYVKLEMIVFFVRLVLSSISSESYACTILTCVLTV